MTSIERLALRIALLELFMAQNLLHPMQDEWDMMMFLQSAYPKIGMSRAEFISFIESIDELKANIKQDRRKEARS